MKNKVAISEVMTHDVFFVYEEEMMSRVKALFSANSIHHLPVLNSEGKTVGIVSSTDLHRREYAFDLYSGEQTTAYNNALFSRLSVAHVMTEQPVVLHPDDDILKAVHIFQENLFHALPIVDKKGILVGILSTYDLLNYAFRDDLLSF